MISAYYSFGENVLLRGDLQIDGEKNEKFEIWNHWVLPFMNYLLYRYRFKPEHT